MLFDKILSKITTAAKPAASIPRQSRTVYTSFSKTKNPIKTPSPGKEHGHDIDQKRGERAVILFAGDRHAVADGGADLVFRFDVDRALAVFKGARAARFALRVLNDAHGGRSFPRF